MKLGCKDFGIDCPFAAEGNAEDVEAKLLHHGSTVHMDKMQAMSESDYRGMVRKMHAER